jgi:hypothetical protein
LFLAGRWGGVGVELMADFNREQILPTLLTSVRLGRL